MVSDWEISLNESQVCASLFTKVAGLCGPFVAIMDPTRHRYCNYTQTTRLMILRAKWIIPCGFVCGGCFSCLKCPLSPCRLLCWEEPQNWLRQRRQITCLQHSLLSTQPQTVLIKWKQFEKIVATMTAKHGISAMSHVLEYVVVLLLVS